MILVVLLTATTLPAQADVLMTETTNCSSPNIFSWVQYKTKGDRGVKAPGESTYTWTLGLPTGQWTTGARQGLTYGGKWYVFATVGIDTDYTTGFCTNFG